MTMRWTPFVGQPEGPAKLACLVLKWTPISGQVVKLVVTE